MIIKKKCKPDPSTLTFAERGLLEYMLEGCDSETGLFAEHYREVAEVGGSTSPTVHRWLRGLIKKGAVTEVVKSRRGSDGYQTKPVLKPHKTYFIKPSQTVEQARSANSVPVVEQVQVIDKKNPQPIPQIPDSTTRGTGEKFEKPVPNGTKNHSTNSTTVDLCSESVVGIGVGIGTEDGNLRNIQPIIDFDGLMDYILQTVKGDPTELRNKIKHLVNEGVECDRIFKLLLAGKKQKGQLTLFDLKDITDSLELDKPTPENLARWKRRFDNGQASCLCPRCGFSGHFDYMPLGIAKNTRRCSHCGYWAYERYFDGKWTPEERDAFESKRATENAKSEARRKAEENNRKTETALRPEAVKVVRQICEHEWKDEWGDAEPFIWEYKDDAFFKDDSDAYILDRIETVLKLMKVTKVPGDELVGFFKQHYRPTEERDGQTDEFTRLAKLFVQESKNIREVYRMTAEAAAMSAKQEVQQEVTCQQ